MKRNRIQRMEAREAEGVEGVEGDGAAERVTSFHLRMIEQRLREAELSDAQRAEVLRRMLEHLREQGG